MRKMIMLLSVGTVCLFLATVGTFAENGANENIEIDEQLVQLDGVRPFVTELNTSFNEWQRWSKSTTVGLWSDESYINVAIKNTGTTSFTFTIAPKSNLTNAVFVGTIGAGKSTTIRVERDDLIIDYVNGLTTTVHVQAYSAGNNVKGDIVIAGR